MPDVSNLLCASSCVLSAVNPQALSVHASSPCSLEVLSIVSDHKLMPELLKKKTNKLCRPYSLKKHIEFCSQQQPLNDKCLVQALAFVVMLEGTDHCTSGLVEILKFGIRDPL